jgi:hypothetical protein
MITKKTVFIVGAGGSCAYGFPSGRTLLHRAREGSMLNVLKGLNYSSTKTRAFFDAVNLCQDLSLDALLEHRDDIEEIGRVFIAHEILAAERKAVPSSADPEKDWISFLFSEMASGCTSLEKFSDNAVTFITYNYDRLIEHRISGGLIASFGSRRNNGDPRRMIDAYWKKHPVIHLHGSLGVYNGSPITYGADPRPKDDFEPLDHAAAGIKVVHQAQPQSAEFKAAGLALAAAERVIFLGFSFGRTNVDRLPLGNIRQQALIVCCRYGMRDAEVVLNITQPFKKVNPDPNRIICNPAHDCLETLRNNVSTFVDRFG